MQKVFMHSLELQLVYVGQIKICDIFPLYTPAHMCLMQALNCDSDDSGVSMSSEAVPTPAARWEYTQTIVDTREDGDTDS